MKNELEKMSTDYKLKIIQQSLKLAKQIVQRKISASVSFSEFCISISVFDYDDGDIQSVASFILHPKLLNPEVCHSAVDFDYEHSRIRKQFDQYNDAIVQARKKMGLQ